MLNVIASVMKHLCQESFFLYNKYILNVTYKTHLMTNHPPPPLKHVQTHFIAAAEKSSFYCTPRTLRHVGVGLSQQYKNFGIFVKVLLCQWPCRCKILWGNNLSS